MYATRNRAKDTVTQLRAGVKTAFASILPSHYFAVTTVCGGNNARTSEWGSAMVSVPVRSGFPVSATGMALAPARPVQRVIGRGDAPRTVSYHPTILRVVLGQAVKWGVIGRNVAALVAPPKAVRYEGHTLTPYEAKQLLKVAGGDRLEALYAVALAIGLRQGEALELRWQDMDLQDRTLTVRNQIQRKDGKLVLVEPKTAKSQPHRCSALGRRRSTSPTPRAASRGAGMGRQPVAGIQPRVYHDDRHAD